MKKITNVVQALLWSEFSGGTLNIINILTVSTLYVDLEQDFFYIVWKNTKTVKKQTNKKKGLLQYTVQLLYLSSKGKGCRMFTGNVQKEHKIETHKDCI